MNRYPIFLLILCCILALCACGDPQSEAKEKGRPQSEGDPPPPEVGYIDVQPRRIALTDELPGRVAAHRTAEIRPQVSGIIQSRLFEEGSHVEQGQQLYQIDPARYEADLQRAKANLQDAQAELKNASSLAGRYQSLIDQEAVSAQEYDDAVAGVGQAEAAIALAEAEVQTAKINLDYTKVYAPISGYIGPSSVTEGALVTAQQETALATIRQLDPVYVDLSQAAAEARKIQERIMMDRISGNPKTEYKVFLSLGNSEETYPHEGALDATDLAVDPQTGTIRLRSVFPNPDVALLPGLFVRAFLEMAGDTKAIVIPQKSVRIQPDGATSVWVIDENDQAKQREVRTGAPYRNNWVILDGLDTGDRVVVEGTMNLRTGAKVRPTKLDEAEATGVQAVPSTPLSDRAPPPDDTLRPPETPEKVAPQQDSSTDGRENASARAEGGGQ
ncbi:MAG: efflux RND transporter periplasmic adaptor subunit [Desulfococcaceae bacterium]